MTIFEKQKIIFPVDHIIVTQNQDIIVSAQSAILPAQDGVCVISIDGATLSNNWIKRFPSTELSKDTLTIEPTLDHHIYGYGTLNGKRRVFKMDTLGAISWDMEYASSIDFHNRNQHQSEIDLTTDNGLIIKDQFYLTPILFKIDSLGKVEWSKTVSTQNATSSVIERTQDHYYTWELRGPSIIQNHIYDIFNNKIIEEACTEDPNLITSAEISLSPQSITPTYPPSTHSGVLTFTSEDSSRLYTPICHEQLRLRFHYGEDTCYVNLTMNSLQQGAAFANLISLATPASYADGSFTMVGTFVYDGDTSTSVINGTSSCITACEDLTLCNEPILPRLADTLDCASYYIGLAQAQGEEAYQNYIDSVRNDLEAKYIARCPRYRSCR